jgi:hypothetical protein
MRSMYARAAASIRSVMRSRWYEPPRGSMLRATPVSSARICWVRSATVTASSVGSAQVSS